MNEKMEELLQKIISKAYEVDKNTKHTIFVNFMGHVKWLEVQVHLNGWKENQSKDIELTAHLDEKEAISELQNILDKLEELEKNVEGGE